MDQYLHWDSNHHITAKQSVYNTLAHRAKIVSSSQDKMDRELQHIRTALQQCQFPVWALNQWQHKFTNSNQPTTTTTNNNNNPPANNKKNITIVVPYMPNTGEKFRKLCKAKDPRNNLTGIIYHYKCPQINVPQCLHRESGRSLGERIKEHFEAHSPVHLHSTTTGHPMDPEQFNIVHKEVNSHSRTIKEPMLIHVQDPTLNRNLGKYQLPHIWDHPLLVSPTLQCKPSSLPTTPTPPNPLLVPPTLLLLSILGTHTFMVSTRLSTTDTLHP